MKITIIRCLLHQALSCRHSLVALEVTLSLQRLVKKYGHELHVVAWDAVLDIVEALQQQIEVWNDISDSPEGMTSVVSLKYWERSERTCFLICPFCELSR